ncbi:DNA alkylation repair protein [Mollicutes bacterium LVI A0078]|nr:DNA alkylation repair protein [Mollicutes bacterium LVI A0075]WOO91211.1 DNA alkylation repair protein [Mollicutes bacterium LVI A0078]
MTTKQLIEVFETNANAENAVKQEAYLKNQFKFLGIAKPIRAKLEKEFVKDSKLLPKQKVIELVFELSNLGYREYLYTSQMVMQANYKQFNYNDILALAVITRSNQWWENTDGFQSFLKKWFRDNPDYIKPFVLEFYKDENLWMRRLAIIAQLGMKDITDFTVMKRAIRYNLKYDEFFIQKAIGWALRDYSKVNPKEVSKFIDDYELKMSNLAIREGSKYL